MTHIIVKNYEHINRSFKNWDTPHGVHVKNKDHYDRLMKENNMIPADKQVCKDNRKEYKLSEKAKAIIQAAKRSADKKGKVKLSDRTIDAMKEIGAIGKKLPDYAEVPKGYKQGGFSK